MKVRDYLFQGTVEDLKELAAFIPGCKSLTRKAELIECIAREVTSAAGQRRQWAELDDLSRKALSQAVHGGGAFSSGAFEAQYGRLPPRPQDRDLYWWKKTAIRLDLFLYSERVPDDVLPGMEEWVPRPEPFQVTSLAQLPETLEGDGDQIELQRADTERSGLQDLSAVLRLIDAGQIQVSVSTLVPSVASIKRILPVLSVGDFLDVPANLKATDVIRPVGLVMFAIQGGLARAAKRPTETKLALTEAGSAWLRGQDPALLLEAFERWTQEGQFDELSRIRSIRNQNSVATQLTKPASRRERIVEALSWCPVGEWIALEDFLRAVRVWQFDPEIEATANWNLYVGYRQEYGMDVETYWRMIQGLYILAVLWEYLATIGALDIAYVPPESIYYASGYDVYSDLESFSLYDGLMYLRINELGAYLLGQHEAYTSTGQTRAPFLQTVESGADLVVRIIAPDELTPADMLALQAIATPLDGQDARGADASSADAGGAVDGYRIDIGSLIGALDRGRDLASSLADLKAWNAGPLPAGLLDLFAEAIGRGEAFGAPVAALTIEAQTPALATMAATDAKLKRLCKLAGDRTLVIPHSREKAFRSRLRELGYVLPKEE